MRTEPLGLQHQALLTPKLEALKLCVSEYNFPNLYLFREIHRYEVVFADKIYIRGKTHNGEIYYMPTERPNADDFQKLQQSVDHPVMLFPVPERWINKFQCLQFTHESLSEDSDFIYSTELMRTYPGRGLSGQRNLVKQFNTLFDSRVVSLKKETREEAIAILKLWKTKDIEADFDACLEAIQRHEELGLTGQVFEVDGEPGALIIGSPLNSTTYLMQFAKADTKFKGIYQYAYQHFALSLDDKYQFLNMEQDLGVPGLHKTKLSYHPVKLETKWRIRAATPLQN